MLNLNHQIILAPGAYRDDQDYSNLGAIITKSITLEPCAGNTGEIIRHYNSYTVNRYGLPNPGIRSFCKKEIYEYKKHNVPIVVSIAPKEFNEIEILLSNIYSDIQDMICGIEINLSCPNIKYSNEHFLDLEFSIKSFKELSDIPIGIKVAPYQSMPYLKFCINTFDFISSCNTLPMYIYSDNGKQVEMFGGMSGKDLKQNSLFQIKRLRALSKDIEIIGIGGIETEDDILDYKEVGANYFGICTAEIKAPGLSNKIGKFYGI